LRFAPKIPSSASLDQIERKALACKMALDVRHDLALHELTHRVTRHPILGAEQFFEVIEVQIH
jgi:hypothetical protein